MVKIKNFFKRIWRWIKNHVKIWFLIIFHFEFGKNPKKPATFEGKKDEKREVK